MKAEIGGRYPRKNFEDRCVSGNSQDPKNPTTWTDRSGQCRLKNQQTRIKKMAVTVASISDRFASQLDGGRVRPEQGTVLATCDLSRCITCCTIKNANELLSM